MNKIDLRKDWSHLRVGCALVFMLLAGLVWMDISVLINVPGFRPKDAAAWRAFSFINVLLLSMGGCALFTTLPDYLAVYTEDGIKWPSLSGYKLLRWSEVTSAEERYTYMKGIKFVITWRAKRIVLAPQIFIPPASPAKELRSRIPPDRWKQA